MSVVLDFLMGEMDRHTRNAERSHRDATCSVEAVRAITNEIRKEVVLVSERIARLDKECRELRADVNGTEWENDLLANAPDTFDGDVAQSEIVTRYVRWLEAENERKHTALLLARSLVLSGDPMTSEAGRVIDGALGLTGEESPPMKRMVDPALVAERP